jgi:LAO/AO transport system kinase
MEDTNLQELLKGRKRAVADALNLLENRRLQDSSRAAQLIEAIGAHGRPDRHIVGLTGPPGVGKSTLLSRMVSSYRRRGLTVGVLSVDPTSRRSGGALLGDRTRIAYDPSDAGIFIRSMAAGRHLGGLAWRTRHCLVLFEAVYDRILIETVGAGQSETEIGQVADSVVYVAQPGSGDSLQFMKAGIMEIPHVLVVNKADQEALAAKAFNELALVSRMKAEGPGRWQARLLMASALKGWGQEELIESLEDHLTFLLRGDLSSARRARRIDWICDMFRERLGSYGVELMGGEQKLAARVGKADVNNPFRVLQELVGAIVK